MNEITTGFYDLDHMLNEGLHRHGLTVIASSPSIGKTSLVLNIATNVAKKVPVVLYNLEMSKQECNTRILLFKTSTELSSTEIYIDNTAAISIEEIENRCRTLKLNKKERIE